MINDLLTVMSDAQTTTGTDTTLASTDALDFGMASPNQGAGNKKVVRVVVNTAVTGGTSIKATLQHSTDDSTYTTLLDGVAVAVASAIAGKVLLEAALPSLHNRYIRVLYTFVGAVAAGKCDAYLNITP